MANERGYRVKILEDGWTVVTEDGGLSAHFEHTVLVRKGQPEILTVGERGDFF
jgi:methionyl aminopeptidase